MTAARIVFIGGGNMARSLVGGLIADAYPADAIHVTDPDKQRLSQLGADFGVHVGDDNIAAAKQADAIVLAVKPQMLRQVAEALAPCVQARKPLVISIAAGVRESDLSRWLGAGVPVVRTMPNTPALVQTGATALYANRHVSDDQRDLAESLLRAAGLTQWLDDEQLMDAVTAISGSGPAYFFLLIEMLEQAGEKLGLPAETARLLTLQTALGAAKMALESEEDAAVLRQRVTSPGGTTERAISTLEQGDIRTLIDDAVRAAAQRAAELGKILGEQ
ncbi:pyrroline-5-carboxylate reductase [Alkalilimnicola ehrlichii]|uniref:Pyrroline-5-carboxylate reductase n=1 Tax=Alkalilimnicola ehrlichii TaxID=351052 RepID=A0A3E0X3V4_9GAMM|nr:pyrroline-5-carboxylate reductase [Alkalilimnicola ehrlichii]RFA31198.1 pyrroline-5-carboxylate reductase [Alkalilimnicola ehrlichii]RFA39520.1 pyrroline-5-carboxylate reductase [Alkalilimnicola ehrlichii]